MFDKDKFQDFINHYYLGGLVKSIIIKSNGNILSARGRNDAKNMIVDVNIKDIGLPTGNYSIYDTGALLSILKILKSPCEVTVGLNKSSIPISLSFTDGSLTTVFVLADESAIPTVSAPKVNPAPDLTFVIDAVFVSQFIKAQSALVDATKLAILSDGTDASLIINYVESQNTNRITLPLHAIVSGPISPLFFNAEYLGAILRGNLADLSQPNTTATLTVSKVASGFVQITVGTYIYYLVGEK